MNFSMLMLLSNYDKHTYLVLRHHVQRPRCDVVLEFLLSHIAIYTKAKGSLEFLSVKNGWATELSPKPLLQLHA